MPKMIPSPSRQPSLFPWLLLMFLFPLNVMSAGGYVLLLLMAVYTILHLRELSFRTTEIFLFLFGVEYFLFYFLWYRRADVGELCNYLVAPWLIHWLGRNMARRCKDSRFPLKVASVLAFGFFTYGLLCMVYTLYFAPPTVGSRVMYKFWDHTPLSVTAGGLMFPMAIGLAFGQLWSKNRLWTRLLWLGVLGVSLYYAFTWAHRSTIYIIAILIAYNYLAFLLTLKTSPARKIALLIGTVVLAAAVALCLAFDTGGCYTWLQGQWLYQRLTNPLAAKSTDRLVIWKNFFEKWLLYPMGGKRFYISSGYVHNMWLDVYYLCGVLPFIALLLVTGRIIRNFFRYRKTQQDHRSAHILANYYLAAALAFMVEPVIDAYPYVFLAVLLVSGCVEGTALCTRQAP